MARIRAPLFFVLLAGFALPRSASANCQLGGTFCGDPGAVSCNTGVVCFPPWRSCTNCTCTATPAGQTCLPATAQPGRVTTLVVDKSVQTPGAMSLSWSPSCAPSGPDYSIQEGTIGTWYSHSPRVCGTSGALSATLMPASGDHYYLVVPVLADYTGSFGTSSGGVERPDGEVPCTGARAIGPCP